MLKKTNHNSFNGNVDKKVVILLTTSLILSVVFSVLITVDSIASSYDLHNPCHGRLDDGEDIITWDCVYFGNYWQNDTNNDGTADRNDRKERIKWRVLEVNEDDEALLISDMNLDYSIYTNDLENPSWETSYTRAYLNGIEIEGDNGNLIEDCSDDNFLDNAFDDDEQIAIVDSTVTIKDYICLQLDDSREYDTEDSIFLPGSDEFFSERFGASVYSVNNQLFRSRDTEYTKCLGGEDTYWIGYEGDVSRYVKADGEFLGATDAKLKRKCSLRPMLWLDLTEEDVWSYAGTVCSDSTIDRNEMYSFAVSSISFSDDEQIQVKNIHYGDCIGDLPSVTSGSDCLLGWYDNPDECVSAGNNMGYRINPDHMLYFTEDKTFYPWIVRANSNPQNPLNDGDGNVIWDCVWFGNYIQKDTNGDKSINSADRKMPIKWRVIKADNDYMLLLADKILDIMPYCNTSSEDGITWTKCSLRGWLNDEFLNSAFDEDEKNALSIQGDAALGIPEDKVKLLSCYDGSIEGFEAGKRYLARIDTAGFELMGKSLAYNTDYAEKKRKELVELRFDSAEAYEWFSAVSFPTDTDYFDKYKGMGEYFVGERYGEALCSYSDAMPGSKIRIKPVNTLFRCHTDSIQNMPAGIRPVVCIKKNSYAWSYAGKVSSYNKNDEGVYEIPFRKTMACTVSFNAAGGSVDIPEKTVVSGRQYGQLPVPKFDGRNFAGWYTSPEGGERIWGDTMVRLVSDHTLYAHWTDEKKVLVFFIARGAGLDVSRKEYTNGQLFGDLPVPIKKGAVFTGWYLGEQRSSARIQEDDIVSFEGGIAYLYAHFDEELPPKTGSKEKMISDPSDVHTDPGYDPPGPDSPKPGTGYDPPGQGGFDGNSYTLTLNANGGYYLDEPKDIDERFYVMDYYDRIREYGSSELNYLVPEGLELYDCINDFSEEKKQIINNPFREGYVFDEDYYLLNHSGDISNTDKPYLDGTSNVVIDEDKTFYCAWRDEDEYIKIKESDDSKDPAQVQQMLYASLRFEASDGEVRLPSGGHGKIIMQKVLRGQLYQFPNAYKEGWDFIGWYDTKSESGRSYIKTGTNLRIDEDKTYKAYFAKRKSVTVYAYNDNQAGLLYPTDFDVEDCERMAVRSLQINVDESMELGAAIEEGLRESGYWPFYRPSAVWDAYADSSSLSYEEAYEYSLNARTVSNSVNEYWLYYEEQPDFPESITLTETEPQGIYSWITIDPNGGYFSSDLYTGGQKEYEARKYPYLKNTVFGCETNRYEIEREGYDFVGWFYAATGITYAPDVAIMIGRDDSYNSGEEYICALWKEKSNEETEPENEIGKDDGNNTAKDDKSDDAQKTNNELFKSDEFIFDDLAANESVSLKLEYKKAVSYNGLKHVSSYNKSGKKYVNDVEVRIDSSLLVFSDPVLKFKNNINSVHKPGKEAYYTLSFKAWKGISKEKKGLIKSVNRQLKSKRFVFDIDPADISKADSIDVKKNRNGSKIIKVFISINGFNMILGKKDYDYVITSDTVVLTGKGNYVGTMEMK